MDAQPEEVEVYAPNGGSKWYSSEGFLPTGNKVVINFIVETEDEVEPLAHGLGIAHNVSMHTKATYIGTRKDFKDLSK